MIVFNVLLVLLFCYVVGKIVFIYLKNDVNKFLYIPIGYVVSQILFLLGIYALGSAYYSYYLLNSIVGIGLLINYSKFYEDLKNIKVEYILISIGIILFISYPYTYYGLDSYWHTASEDCFDAINGKDYILGNISTIKDFILNSNSLENYVEQRGGINYFLSSHIVFQYSSVALWSLFPMLGGQLDSFLIQSLANIIMMFFGIVLFTQNILNFSKRLSYIIAFISIFSNLYLTTYFNTHEGSMIFGALVPFMLYIFFRYENTGFKNKKLLFLLVIMSIFIFFSYRHPFIFFFIPILIYIFKDKIIKYIQIILNKKIYLMLSIVVALLAFYYMYEIAQYWIDRKNSRFRSWGISLEPEMLLIYWGLVQSQVTNIGASTGFIYYNLILKYSLYLLSMLFTAVTMYGYLLISKKHIYFKYFMFFWILFFILFKFIIADSYYFYKFLYTTQFVFMVYFVYGLKSIYEKNKFLKIFSIMLFMIFLISNLYYNISSNNKIYNAMQNKNNSTLKQILEIPKDLLEESFLEIPKQYLKQIAQVNLRTNKIFTKIDIKEAKYIVLMKSIEDIYFNSYTNKDVVIVYENDSFKVIEKPKYYLSLRGPWESEVFKSDIGNFSNIPFRWMSHDIGGGNISITTITNKKYLQACFESGPSIGFGKFDINFNNKKYIVQGVDCKYFEVDNNEVQYKLYSKIKGKKLLPFDARSLEYKIANVRNADSKYEIDVLKILNPKNDIVNQDFQKENNIVIGNGWYPQELPNMRWGSDNVELLILNAELDRLNIEFDIEPGPSLKEVPLKIDILNDNNEKIGHMEIDKREKIIVTLPVKEKERYQIIKLKVLNDTKKLQFDPRDLNIRLFSVKVIG